MNAANEFDLGPLTWVKGEIDAALDRAADAFAQYRKADGDLTQLKFCRTHLHQVHGALSIVALDGVTQVTEALELLLAAIEEGRGNADAITVVDGALLAIRQYLDGLLAGESNQPLRLLPVYQTLVAARGGARSRPSDLFFPDLSVRPPKSGETVKLEDESFRVYLKNERMRFQKGLLALLRNAPGSEPALAGLTQMKQALQAIEITQDSPSARSFWWISRGFLDSLADRGLAAETETKQLCARIDLQIRRLLEGSRNVAERLMRDALYYVGQSRADGEIATQVRSRFQLASLIPQADANALQAPQEAELRRLREVVNATEEFWNKFCAGSASALPNFAEQARNCAQISAALGNTDVKRLGQGLAAIANWLAEQPARQSETVAMEVATGILLLQNAQENYVHLGTDFARQVDLMVARLHGCISGNPAAETEEIPLLDEITRRAQEKLLIAQVAREIQNNLAQVEQTLDAFFRDPSQGLDVQALEGPLNQIGGALAILGHDAALAALNASAARIRAFGVAGYVPAETDFEEVAQQLSTLGFFVDALQTGVQDYERFAARLRGEPEVEEEGAEEMPASTVEAELEQKMGDTQALIAALQEAPEDDRLKDELKQNLQALQADADLVADSALGETAKAALTALESGVQDVSSELAAMTSLKPNVAEAPAPSAETLKLAQSSHEEIDAELLEIFLEEAQEVLANIASELAVLREQPHNADTLTNIRRGAHTLKGSGRMVGLKDLGETAWAVEQTLNQWLRQEMDVNDDLLLLIEQTHVVFGEWVRELAANSGMHPDPSALVALAERLRGIEPLASVQPAAEIAPAMPQTVTPAAEPETDEMPAHLAATFVGNAAFFDAKTIGLDVDGEAAEEMPADLAATFVGDAAFFGEPDVQEKTLPESDFGITLDFGVAETQTAPSPAAGHVETLTPLDAASGFPEIAPASAEIIELPLPTPEEPAPSLTIDFDLALPAADQAEATAGLAAEEIPASGEEFSFDMSFDAGPAEGALEIPAPAVAVTEEVRLPDAPENIELPLLVEEELAEEEGLAGESTPLPLVAPESPSLVEDAGETPAVAEAFESIAGDSALESVFEIPAVEGDWDDAPVVPPAVPAEAAVTEVAAIAVPTLYDIFREEARSHLDTLQAEYAVLEADPTATTTFAMTRAAHTLGGIAATVGLMPINKLAIALEHALLRRDNSVQPESIEGIETIRQTVLALQDMFVGLMQQRESEAPPPLLEALGEIFPVGLSAVAEPEVPAPVEAAVAPALEPEVEAVVHVVAQLQDAPVLLDELDEQLLPIFLEEAQDLVRGFGEQIVAWRADIGNAEPPRALARLMHTFKGGARMAGAMNLGEMTHALESSLEEALRGNTLSLPLLEEIENGCDTLNLIVERLQAGESPTLPLPVTEIAAPAAPAAIAAAVAPTVESAPVPAAVAASALETEAQTQRALIRVRADMVDRLVNEAGELSIARARIEGEMRGLKTSLLDLTENVIRLRRQLRDIEIQAEGQIQARAAQSVDGKLEFDPLELDRFTRFQELTRFMAESVNDVATVQQSLLKNLDDANAAIVAQSRMNRALQQDLMSIRMEPFGSQAQRLYRIARQTAKELDKRVDLDIRGSRVELDRSMLDKIMAPIEHMLRNAISHGIEDRAVRVAAGKPEIGDIVLALTQEGNEIVVSLTDDGRGLDAARIRARAESQGMLAAGEEVSDAKLYDFIFQPGFSTASEVTQISGRGVGMDIVKAEVSNLGGRIEIATTPGQGTTFRLYLPLTMAMAQTLLVRAAGTLYAIPSPMIEQVMELKESALESIRARGMAEWLGNRYPYHFLPHLLGQPEALPETRRRYWVLLLRSGVQRIAVHVDELAGNQEVVVKNIGAQLSRVAGIAGATVLGDGRVVLILNPVALLGRESVAALAPALRPLAAVPVPTEPAAAILTQPTVMVVDDSLTVRKITGRLLAREGYQVITAKDGVDALEHLVETVPDVMLSDIEMPRMDGFDLVRNVRADSRLKQLPIIMITSRTADKHRSYAMEIGANEYLGKPYDEETLLGLIAGFIKAKRGG